jgi:cyclophilin family peptidyl-prolyl cis-trans isomerase
MALAGQNQPPVLESLIPNQMMDQGGSAMKLDLTQFFKDPDVSSPAVKIDVKIAGNTKQIYFGLLKEAAPLTSSNFVAYIEAGHFAENFIHRSVPGFIIQGGGFRFSQVQTIQDVPNFDPVINEPGISNTRGTVAMAKLGGNPNSATSEWFINLANNASNLDNQNGGFTVFARVLGNGMTVADEIVALRVYDASYQLGSGAFGELPLSAPTLARSSFVETAASLVSPLQFSAESNAPNIVSLTLSLDGELTMTPSPINAGEAIISITVTDLEGGITESSFKVTVNSKIVSFEDWQSNFNFDGEENAGWTGDQDRDGWNNLIEYVLGTNPLSPNGIANRFKALGNGNVLLTFQNNVTPIIRIESSTDLKTWTNIWQTDQSSSALNVASFQDNGDETTVTLRPNPFGINLIPRYWRFVVVENEG